MVSEFISQKAQDALVARIEKRFDGTVYHGGFLNPRFAVDFYPNDRDVVTKDDVAEFIEGFTVTYEDDEYVVTIDGSPDTDVKYQYVCPLEQVEE